jgi:hypothetical protein
MFLYTKRNLKIEFIPCTIPVAPTANSIGKNIQNTGKSKVPNPKPEKKVRIVPTKIVKINNACSIV